MSRQTNGYLRKRDPPEEAYQTDVLIVGANTGGLLLSLDLARKNINHLVINSCDRNKKEVNGEDISEQYVLYPRTLEIFHDLNILSEVRNRSLKLTGVSFYVGNKLINQTDKTFFQSCNGSTSYMLSINKTTLNNILRRKLASINSDAVQDGTILWGLSQRCPSTCTRGKRCQVPHDRKKSDKGMHSTVEPIVGKKTWGKGFFFWGERGKNGAVEKNAHDDSLGGKPTTDASTGGSPTSDTQPSEHQPSEHQPSEHQPSEHQPSEDRPKKPLHCSIRSKFIVGVDGRKSSIRKLANIKMEEKASQPIEYISVDVCAKWNIDMSHYNLTLVQYAKYLQAKFLL
ncbi:hypothetical protein PCYB_053450 [Plasmodium cynomolgi strain B]|uniref:FAD-binding domain-containing protein n=1 Tax=Plasmodium cynomolgi (strain B) TaxID=1120755 RepID=K6V860_PLACD|nr:hypothetical protein PCYB_053450 [Plasmodium cynomolgi strain B]GAB65327.1 hypothetical protein PCYB_053450 [Plasmodium cynomolgi strain B]